MLEIALQYGTSIEAIGLLNPNIDLDLVFPGQAIVIPLATPTETATPTITPTPSFTPSPAYPAPQLLSPANEQVTHETSLTLSWTSTTLLAEDEFYVLYVGWPDGTFSEFWGQQSSWRLSRADRRGAGPLTWRVAILRQTGVAEDGTPLGEVLADSIEERTVEWR